jgi:hypothetical protein
MDDLGAIRQNERFGMIRDASFARANHLRTHALNPKSSSQPSLEQPVPLRLDRNVLKGDREANRLE